MEEEYQKHKKDYEDAAKELEKFSREYTRNQKNEDTKSIIDDKSYRSYFRIPDMYKLTFKFKSLLPTNFNTYMMTFFEKPVLEEKFEDGNGHFTTIYDDFGVSVAEVLGDIVR